MDGTSLCRAQRYEKFQPDSRLPKSTKRARTRAQATRSGISTFQLDLITEPRTQNCVRELNDCTEQQSRSGSIAKRGRSGVNLEKTNHAIHRVTILYMYILYMLEKILATVVDSKHSATLPGGFLGGINFAFRGRIVGGWLVRIPGWVR